MVGRIQLLQALQELPREELVLHILLESYRFDLDTSKLRQFECVHLFEEGNTSDTVNDRDSTEQLDFGWWSDL